jgi:hypothetical protein
MKEVIGNLWTYPADVRVITTNGTVKKNGECVMGRGCAFEAKQKWSDVPKMLGAHLERLGNIPMRFPDNLGLTLVSFSVKHHWHQKADVTLIQVSARILSAWADLNKWQSIVMPRPGCGNGGLDWKRVSKLLEPILDDRFHVITFGKE